jgi:branched-chain amino acid transport system permease protein
VRCTRTTCNSSHRTSSNIIQSIDLLLMIVIGGVGSVHGAFLGAIFLISMPQVIGMVKDYLPAAMGQAPGLQGLVYGLVLIAFVLFEPWVCMAAG